MKRYEAVFYSLEVIEERIREKLTVENLAGSVHFSKYHYQRLFREAVGESVMRYVARRRMALAAQELAGTDASILEIALKYGYDSHEGFTRSFRAHMGITPAEYRKYHFSIGFPQTQKERGAIMYARNTDEIIKELNQLIVQARETVDFTAKIRDIPDAAAYAEFWDYTAHRTEAAADALTKMLECITAIARRPDEISARFMILKAVEDAAFQFQLTAFQTRLTVSRAKPEHRKAFEPICGQYDGLAHSAGMRAGRIAGFLGELAELIFRDMRENAQKCLQEAVESGRAAVDALADPALPYGYIADAVRDIADELSSLP
ncbi:MAG: helix-turn-helix transcriptional regulator, partial [Acetatifactor sp.]|nr:helix-turn-helix transcriptional regulator [Acetatifactor sp.]